jgi:CubicO group peptidase (beta-lactamase class C family)
VHLLLAALLALSQAQRLQIDAIVAQVMHDRQIAGLSLGIARKGTRVYLRGYGERDATQGLLADGYTIYRVGSIAKQFTAALILQEVARGAVALDAPLQRYLPALTGAPGGRTTVTQLLGQTSGIVSTAAATQLAFDPGTGWLYSNANYTLLGSVLQRTTGIGYAALLRERIAAPLALPSTGCGISPAARNVARGSSAAIDSDCSSSGMTSNASDLLDWLEGLRAGRIISSPAFAAMATSGTLAGGMPTNYGFGFFVTKWFGYRAIEHPGYVNGFSAQDALVLDDGLEVVVLTNRDAVDLTPLTKSIVAFLDPPRDANAYATPSRPPQNENSRTTSDLKAIVGTSGFASFGALLSIEFIERSFANGLTYDKYRLTFSAGQWWATVGYRSDGTIAALTFSPTE